MITTEYDCITNDFNMWKGRISFNELLELLIILKFDETTDQFNVWNHVSLLNIIELIIELSIILK